METLRLRLMAAAAVVALAAVGCGGGGTGEGAGSAADPPGKAAAVPTVAVEMGNYFVTADPASAPAGTVRFQNDVETGADAHALTVLRTDPPPDGLPTDVEGRARTIEEDIEVMYSEAPTGEAHSADVELEPGSYVLICNVANH